MSKTKHTDCKLSLDKTDIYFEGFMIAVTNPSEGANWLRPEYAEANAARLVKCWNMHDELVDTLKFLLENFDNEKNSSNAIVRANKLINQSEQP